MVGSIASVYIIKMVRQYQRTWGTGLSHLRDTTMQAPQLDTHIPYFQLLTWVTFRPSIPHFIKGRLDRERQWVFENPNAIALTWGMSRGT